MNRADASQPPQPPAGWASPARLLQARQRQWRLAVAGLCVLVLASAGWAVHHERGDLERLALAQAELHARVLEGQASRTLGMASSMLRVLSEAPLLREQGAHPGAASHLLRDQLSGQPLLRSLSLLDASGLVIGGSASDLGRRIDIGRLGPVPGTASEWLGPPLPVRELGDLADRPAGSPAEGGTVTLPMVRKFKTDAGGTLYLVALVNSDYFATQHDLILEDTAQRPMVTDLQGHLFSAGREVALPPGTSLQRLPLFSAWLPQREHGSYIGAGSEHAQAVTAFRTSRAWPLVVVVELPYAELQRQWVSGAAKTGASALGLCLLLGVVGRLADRGIRRERDAQGQLARLHEALERNEERWHLALDGAGHGVWDWDIASGRIDVSPRMQDLLGRSRDEASWTLAQWREAVHPADLTRVVHDLEDHLAGRTKEHIVELRLQSGDGNWRWFQSRSSLTRERNAKGRPVRLIGTCTDITERRESEAALMAIQARQQAILSSSLDGILTIDGRGLVIDFNEAAARIFGHAAADVIGQPMQQLIVPPQHRQAHQAGMARYQATGVARMLNRRIEVEALRADGSVFPVELTVVPVQTADGEIFTATVRDITERRRTANALRESEAQLRATFEQAAVGMLQQARDRRVLRVNQALCDLLGCDRETLLDRPFGQRIHPDDVEHGLNAMERLFEGTLASFVQEKRYRHEDGRWVWVRLTASVARDAEGHASYMICVVESIEAQRRVEQERNALLRRFEETANALRRQRRALDEHAIVSIADPEGRIVYANSKLTSVSGFAFEDLVGRQHSLLSPAQDGLPPEQQPQQWTASGARAIPGEVRECVLAGRIWEGELLHMRKDGKPFWAASTVVPMVGDDGALQEILVIQTDITQRVQAEQRVQEARRAEMAIGARIQQSLLVEPPDQRLPGLWLSTFSQASQGVDGDFIEIIPLGDHTVDIIAGDVMGKGVGAALMGAGTKMQFSRSIADLMARPETEGLLPSPAEIVAAVHRAMTPNLQALDAFVTLNYVRIDDRAGTVTWVGCGHEEPLLVRADGSTATLANQHPPLGVLDDETYTQHTLSIARDDALFLCSDGAVDALLPDGERVGKARVHAALQRLLSRQRAPAAVLHALRAELQALGARFTDDLTMALAVRTRRAALDSRRELPARLQSIADVRGLVEVRSHQAGLGEEEAALFAVASVEGFTNAVRHGQGRPADAPVELLVSTHPDALVVELVHLGQPFEPPEHDAPTVFDDYPEGGFGLQIMRSACDRVEHLHHHGINTLRLTRWLAPRDEA